MRSRLLSHLRRGALALTVIAPTIGGAQSLSGNLTVDNSFAAYLSTTATTQGTLISRGTNWTSTYHFSNIALAPGQDYFLQVRGTDVGVISAFLGSFQLSGSDFAFANGTQFLNTNVNDWFVSSTGFGIGLSTPISEGLNGAGPWGTRPRIDGDASWIWSDDRCVHCTRYFQTQIRAVAHAIPEPQAYVLLALGAVGLFVVRRRRRA